MEGFKNIIFDLGAVLMNINYNKTVIAFQDLGVSDFENMYSLSKANKIFKDFETGRLTETGFYEYILKAGKDGITKGQVTGAWNAMLLDFRVKSLYFLIQLGRQKSLFLLSNTNTIHKAAFERNLLAQTGFYSLDRFFKTTYYSHLVGMRKPNEDIFRFVQQDAGIIPPETLFIDDVLENIETAGKLGFQTQQLFPGVQVEDLEILHLM